MEHIKATPIDVPLTYMLVTYKSNFTGVQTAIDIKHLKPTVFRIENAFQMNLSVHIWKYSNK